MLLESKDFSIFVHVKSIRTIIYLIMRVLADGGSTKTDWLLIHDNDSKERFTTYGINPSLLPADEVETSLRQVQAEHSVLFEAESIEFYGAGCTPAGCSVMRECMQTVFPKAKHLTVGSDIIGAARALLPDREGIACILGTGANSCLWDGERIVMQTPALGYILGDEGSGAVLGRLLVNALYKGMLPASMKAEFENEYQTDMMGVIERVYRKPATNRWLASLSPFVCKHIDCPEVEGLVISNFDTFVERNILPYNRPDLPVSFVGSIAHYYGRQLRQSVESHGLVMGRVLRSPLDAMI